MMDTWYRIDQVLEPTGPGKEPCWIPILCDPRAPAIANRFEIEAVARELLDYIKGRGCSVRLVRMTAEVVETAMRASQSEEADPQ